MNVKKLLKQLDQTYPNKIIIKNKDEKGTVTEIVCEIEPTSMHPEYSLAIAVIDSSKAHFHKIITEKYKVIKGTLHLFVNEKEIILSEGDTYIIKPKNEHYALGNETWIEAKATPGWKIDDHFYDHKKLFS